MPSTDPWNGDVVSDCRDRVAWKNVPQKYKDALAARSATAHTRTCTGSNGRTQVETANRCYMILIKNIVPWVDSGFQQGPNFELVSLIRRRAPAHARQRDDRTHTLRPPAHAPALQQGQLQEGDGGEQAPQS
mmetsp:Transcript_73819/g.210554  ORF Transcript_73819/g.210554 Transcript_73819/m.210554 type:complete len:132 (-) Transcript_73819:283-678(-)